jgi:ubiquinone biosynthesis protein
VFLEMIFRDGFYHADPHPGNILVLPGGVLGMLDCGMVGRLDDRLREDIEDVLLAIVQRDAQRLAAQITRIGAIPPHLDTVGLNADLADFLSYHGGQSLDQFDLGGALTEMTEIIRRYHILLPTGVALLLKVLILLEGTSRQLNPGFSLIALMQPYQRKVLWRRLSPDRYWQKLRRLAHEWEVLGEVLPRSLVDILQQMQKGRFDVRLEHERLEPAVNRLVWGLLTGALFLGSAWLWSYRAPPLLGGVSVPGVLGCALSFALGLRLLWAIRKSGRLEDRL